MRRPRTSLEDELRGLRAFQAYVAYHEDATRTPAGRRSDKLRERAHRIVRDGDQVTAHDLYREALGLFDPADDGAAAAAAAYDLAESYATADFGVQRDNLREAERLYRRSLASPARRQDPTRLALSWDGLARCLRHMAAKTETARGREALLDEAERCFEQALLVLAPLGRFGWMHSSDYTMNLGNLHAQRGQFDRAIARYEEVQTLAEAVEADPHLREQRAVYHDEPTLPRLNANFASVLLRRNKAGDLDRALRCAAAGALSPLGELRAMCRLLRAQILLKMGKKRRPEALEALHAVQVRELDRDQAVTLIELLGRHGRPEAMACTATEAVQAILQERRRTLADHVADHHAAQAQRIAWIASRVLVERGEAAALDAFLLLESVSGLRTLDSIGLYHYRPTDGVAIALNDRRSQWSYLATHLDDLAGRLSLAPPEQQRQMLLVFLDGLPSDPELPEDPTLRARLSDDDLNQARVSLARHRAALEEALLHASPMAHLQDLARAALAENERISRLLDERDPQATRQGLFWNGTLDRRGLRHIFEDHPDHALLRLHSVGDELVAACIWCESGQLRARGHRRTISGLHRDLAALLSELAPDAAALGALLVRIDLEPVLPPTPREHLVVLPNLFASRLPLCALGPRGRTPLDRFQAISVMPTLTPLAMRQGAQRPRHGLLVVAPGVAGSPPTALHDSALGSPCPDERWLAGADATVDATHAASQHADVIRFYAHGGHFGEMSPHIHLVDGPLELDRWRDTWAGAERVELWACATGVDLPRDPLSPSVVDEGFGLDVLLLQAGARSALGTLWEVPEGAVAGLLRHYREALATGRSAPHALADAQRAWRDRGREELLAEAQLPTSTIQALTHPAAWAGYRFVGVAERRPVVAWTSDHDRRPTAAEQAEAEQLLRASAPDEPAQGVDDLQTQQIDQRSAFGLGALPSAVQAAEAGRAWLHRLASSGPHSLLIGLAWLHEALADPALPATDAATIRLDAAWGWLELARDEVVFEQMTGLCPPDPVLLTRGERSLDGTSGPLADLLKAWAASLRAGGRDREAMSSAAERGLGAVSSAVEGLEAVDAPRGLALACQILLTLDQPPAALGRRVLGLVRRTQGEPVHLHNVTDAGHLAAAAEALAVALREEDVTRHLHLSLYPGRSLARRFLLDVQRTARADGTDGAASLSGMETLNNALAILEGRLWGYPDDDHLPFWSSTGTPGRAWEVVMGQTLLMMAKGPGAPQKTAHLIANLENGCDLRLGMLNTWARLWGRAAPIKMRQPLEQLHHLVWAREQLVLRLMGATTMPASVDPADHGRPHRLDPFSLPTEGLVDWRSYDDLPAWCLHDALVDWWGADLPARTAAGRAARLIAGLDQSIRAQWSALAAALKEMPEAEGRHLQELIAPAITLAQTERRLQDVADGEVIVGLAVSPDQRLILMSLWRQPDGPHGQVAISEPGAAVEVRRALALLDLPERAPEVSHATLWSRLDRALRPLLDRTLQPALPRAQVLSVLAPGPLRSLPWLGLRVGGRPLHEQVVVRLLPDLSWGRIPPIGPPGPGQRTACALPPDEPETAFGLKALRTLRARFPACAPLEAPAPCGQQISEVERLRELAPQMQILRLYGQGGPAPVPAAAGLELRWERHLSGHLLRGLWLPHAEVVELWAATGGIGAGRHLLSGSGDSFPGLIWPLLATGAGGLVDLAWDVPDLVRALVAERFGVVLRTRGGGGAAALREAVAWTAEVLALWRSAGPFSDPRAALRWLDGLRLLIARREGYDGPLDAHATANADALPTESVEAWLDDLAHPRHLASFRWWGR